MLKPILLGACLALTAAGCAVSPETRLAAQAPKPTSLDCLQSTGTRIKLGERECSAATGRSYSKDDLDRTGAATTAEALRRLDPSITRGW
jgi:hypothetical protein